MTFELWDEDGGPDQVKLQGLGATRWEAILRVILPTVAAGSDEGSGGCMGCTLSPGGLAGCVAHFATTCSGGTRWGWTPSSRSGIESLNLLKCTMHPPILSACRTARTTRYNDPYIGSRSSREAAPGETVSNDAMTTTDYGSCGHGFETSDERA